MQSMSIQRFGDMSVFEEITLPHPTIKPGHVIIKVIATSVNPFDYKLRQGIFPDLIQEFPAILHGDIAGIITEVGAEVTEFAVGDKVYGCVGGILNMGGGLAEFVLADVDLIAHAPRSIPLEDAAALPLVALTAWEGLVTYAGVQEGETVLIHGGTGGVGHIAIQLAKWLGAEVYATCSTEQKQKIAQELGADKTIDYTTQDVQSYVATHTQGSGFDTVFDTVGGDNLPYCIAAANLFGKVITISAVGSYDLTPAFFKGLSLHILLQPLPLITGVRRADYNAILAKIAELVDDGFIRPLIDEKRFSVKQIGEAHQHLEMGSAIGKVVVAGF